MEKNIFELWIDNNKQLPFIAYRVCWKDKKWCIVVENVEPKGNYGKAYGYSAFIDSNSDIIKTDDTCRIKKGLIQNAGSFQWDFFEFKKENNMKTNIYNLERLVDALKDNDESQIDGLISNCYGTLDSLVEHFDVKEDIELIRK